jgi:hypothetical protein
VQESFRQRPYADGHDHPIVHYQRARQFAQFDGLSIDTDGLDLPHRLIGGNVKDVYGIGGCRQDKQFAVRRAEALHLLDGRAQWTTRPAKSNWVAGDSLELKAPTNIPPPLPQPPPQPEAGAKPYGTAMALLLMVLTNLTSTSAAPAAK